MVQASCELQQIYRPLPKHLVPSRKLSCNIKWIEMDHDQKWISSITISEQSE